GKITFNGLFKDTVVNKRYASIFILVAVPGIGRHLPVGIFYLLPYQDIQVMLFAEGIGIVQTVSEIIVHQLVLCTVVETAVGQYNDGLPVRIIGIAVQELVVLRNGGIVRSPVGIG